jgi:hypothetical protein
MRSSRTLTAAFESLLRVTVGLVSGIVLAHASGVEAGVVVGSEDLLIRPHVEQEEYCRDRNGADQVRLTVGFSYLNKGSRPLVVPIVTRLSEVQVHADGMKPIRLRYGLSKLQGISPAIYTESEPNPKLFYRLSPASTQEGMHHVVVLRVLAHGSKPTRSAVGPGVYRLAFRLNLGSRLPGDPYVSSDHWRDAGVLIVGGTPTEAIAIRISERSTATCQQPRLIM